MKPKSTKKDGFVGFNAVKLRLCFVEIKRISHVTHVTKKKFSRSIGLSPFYVDKMWYTAGLCPFEVQA